MTSRRLANVAKAVFTFLLALLVVALSSPDLREFFDDLAPVSQSDEPSAATEAWIDPAFLKELGEEG